MPRPMRSQTLYRRGDDSMWLVNNDGAQHRQLKLQAGRVGPANWAVDGRTLLYLDFPEDPKQLNTIREHTPDANTDKLIAKTSQFAHFGFPDSVPYLDHSVDCINSAKLSAYPS